MSAVVLVVALTVALLLLARGPLQRQATLERIALALTGTLLLLALVSLLAVRLGIYSAGFASVGVVLLASAASWSTRRFGPLEAIPFASDGEHGGRAVAPLLVCLGALYVFYPTYFVLGGQDPGLYLIFAAHIAKTGGLDLDLPWLRELWTQHPHGLALGYPGIYSLVHSNVSDDPTRLSPQFAHLFPALAANAWSLGGLEGLVRVNAVIAVLALTVGFAFTRRLAGWACAFAFVVILGLNPAFLWGARITLTETLGALVTLTGLLALLYAQHQGSRAWAAMAGSVFGLGVLNRLDAGFSGLAIVAFAVASLLDRRLVAAARVAGVSYLAASTLGFIDVSVNAPFYFLALRQNHHLGAIIAVSSVAGLLAVGLTLVPASLVIRLRVTDATLARAGDEMLRALVIWIGLALFAWPAVDPSPSAHAARELSWYVTPLAWPLLILGAALLLKRRVWGEVLPLLTLAGATLVVFTVGPHVVPQHIWASRRWVPQVIPLLTVLAVVGAAGVVRFAGRVAPLRRWVTVALGLSYLVPALEFDRPFLFRSMLAGLPEAYLALKQRIGTLALPAPLVTSNVHLASPLTYLYDVPTALIGGRLQFGFHDAMAHTLVSEGELGGLSAVGLGAFELHNTPLLSGRFVGDYLEVVEGQRPRSLMGYQLPFDLGELGGRGFEFEVNASEPGFVSEVGIQGPDGSIRATGRAGTLLRGPGVTLTRGQYEVDFVGRLASTSGSGRQGALKVTGNVGANTLGASVLRLRPEAQTETWIGGLDFNVDDDGTEIDFELDVGANVDLSVTRVRLRRVRPLGMTVPVTKAVPVRSP